jgi:hypothetical protein
MIDGEFIVRMINLPGDIHGAVRLSEDGFANIYINDQLAPDARRRAFDHEMKHIINGDFYNGKPIQEVEG